MKFVLWAIFSGKDQNHFFSPSVDCRATVDPFNDFKSRFRVKNLIVESNILSKSGLRTEIGQLLVEISLLCHHKISEIILFGNIGKKLKNYIYCLISIILIKNDLKCDFLQKKIKIFSF